MEARELFIGAVAEHQDLFYGIARNVLGDTRDAEDAVQTAYAKTYSSLGNYRGDAKLKNWISSIVTNAARDLRRKVVCQDRVGRLNENLDFTVSNEIGPLRRAELAEFVDELMEAVGTLPERYRIVFALRYFEHYSDTEIAEKLGREEGNVRFILHHARRDLRQRLHQHDPRPHEARDYRKS